MASDRTRSKSITLSDVAKDAGVSPMTVSRVINGEISVRESTRISVQESIRKLKYRPNIGARRLAGAKVARICLLYGNPSSSYLGELLLGAVEKAGRLGHQLVVIRASEDLTAEMLAQQYRTQWDGIILPSPMGDEKATRDIIAKEKIPAVFTTGGVGGRRKKLPHSFELGIDNRAAARAITQKLIDLGHTRIGFIKGRQDQAGSLLRYKGFCDAMEAANLEVNPLMVEQGDFTYLSGMEAAERMLTFDPRPTAVFAANDDMAAGVIGAGSRQGLMLPGDLSVAGFDDSPIATSIWPHLTTIHQPVSEIGAYAVECLDQIIFPKDDESVVTKKQYEWLEYTLIERASTAPPSRFS
ncbi:LacI family DNA-binding transcriptional regulator [Hirschia baltica]|uniref:Transcriptional regulator, LacI family n=1 Tax=Hirschia baltica (strain ATCC 49814 / DSM 5838 / IFAM 1418) TaxID=582402 RepID=C6XLL4_HIRBI|nr:LacI family DNA-binding transcriptional regulator [Hirschia baltica]ACT57920.1 transcriptional regulator, LacI family [Hirschia baltica ATCC 49814]